MPSMNSARSRAERSPSSSWSTSSRNPPATAGIARRAVASPSPSPAALHVADGCRGPLLARLRRIHPPDRRAHRRGLRPVVERDRRGIRARSRRPRAQAVASHATPGAASPLNWPVDGGGRLPVELVGPAGLTIARAISPAIAGFGVCRDLDGLTGLRRCAASNSSAASRRPDTFGRYQPGGCRRRASSAHSELPAPTCAGAADLMKTLASDEFTSNRSGNVRGNAAVETQKRPAVPRAGRQRNRRR